MTQGCPCGHLGNPRKPCRCTPALIRRYRSKISGPLLDRIDLHVEVPPVGSPDLFESGDGEGSAAVAERVERARHRERFPGQERLHANAQMGAREVRRYCEAGSPACTCLNRTRFSSS